MKRRSSAPSVCAEEIFEAEMVVEASKYELQSLSCVSLNEFDSPGVMRDIHESTACDESTAISQSSLDTFNGAEALDRDDITLLSVSTPRSRLDSDYLFDDIDAILRSSNQPPVGTTRPPLYPKYQGPFSRMSSNSTSHSDSGDPPRTPQKRVVKRLVNKRIDRCNQGTY